VKFINPKGILIMLHKPHPSHIMKHEQLYGKVLGLKGHISYEGATGKQLEAVFMDAIDSYLADCKLDRVASE
jgi:predicted HicB family RNase H-like nuclease